MSSTHPSIYRLTAYYLPLPRRQHYPSFKLRNGKSFFFPTLQEAEEQILSDAEKLLPAIYAYVVTEIPLGIAVNLDVLGESLSERIYLPNGTLWGVRSYCNFIPSSCSGNAYDSWGRLNRFYGREPEEIRFAPGDIVEVFGFPGNDYWGNGEVNLAIVVKCPPTKEQVAESLAQYIATHAGLDVSDHSLSVLFGKGMDVYHVLSETCDSIDRAPTIALFKPSQNVSKQRETKLKALYQQYHNPPRK